MDRFNGFLRRDTTKKECDVTVKIVSDAMEPKCRPWKPVTLRRPFLFSVILVTLGLLALVQVLVIYDQRHDGILFATKISELGMGYIFLYRYFPTIISVSYGLVWHWIDVDTRRVEPYRQLSKPGGASGRDSLLLRYPTDLLAFVPLKALRRKHWSVVISSFALVLVGMGLTPLQAAMFATETVTKVSVEPMQVSTQHMSIEDQAAQVTANYTYSVSNILWLDERLPRFMSKEAAFTPFRPGKSSSHQLNETWSTNTTLFSMDVGCTEAKLNQTKGWESWDSPQGCRVRTPFGPDGSNIIGSLEPVSGSEIKEFQPFFAGNQNHDGLADYYLSGYCPDSASNVFFVALARNRRSAKDAPGPVTRLFCETSYYEQTVAATVRQSDGRVMSFNDTGPKLALPPGTFNTSLFEWQINSATQQNTVRSTIPSTKWPDQDPQLAQLPISFSSSDIKMTHIVGLAIGAYPRPTEDYMDPQVLAASFQAVHRLLFARSMVDVLKDDFEEFETANGTRTYQTQAVRIVPRFAYAVEAVLGIVALMTTILMILSWGRFLNLLSDPDSLLALMMLVKGQNDIQEEYAPYDQSSWDELKAATCESSYSLSMSQTGRSATLELQDTVMEHVKAEKPSQVLGKNPVDYPFEFSISVGIVFTLGLVAALIGATYLYHTGLSSGLSLPSQNLFVRQMLENYIPMVIATLIEPVWVVLNRLLCLLQPFEELRSASASPQRSIGLSYSSLPPQFVIFKALRARHVVLAAVCAMALLANVLAVALGGMLNEETLAVPRSLDSFQLFEPVLREGLENVTRLGPNPFYAAMANFTSNTPMPPWTDDTAFYMPVSLPGGLNESDYLEVKNLPSIGIQMKCEPLGSRRDYSWSLVSESFNQTIAPKANLTVNIPDDDHKALSCAPAYASISTADWPVACSGQNLAFEMFTTLRAKVDKNQRDQDPCKLLIASIWARNTARSLCGNGTVAITDEDAMAMVCKPTVFSQLVNVTVTGGGIVHNVHRTDDYEDSPDPKSELTREAIRALSESVGSRDMWSPDNWAGSWHNDTFPSDWITYAMSMMHPDSHFLDPEAPLPGFEDTAEMFTKTYQKLFAIWLGLNHESLLVSAKVNETMVASTLTQPEVRIKVSRAMLILSASILGLYVIVAIAVYAHRPGKYLPHMPLTMASDIAMFAASTAVREMENSPMASRQRHGTWLDDAGVKFGYGTFVGTDGKPHVGVERAPFVVPLP
ncbi:hypothetical protein MBLNU13_g02212t1 [Cladosporium sp. NU13]